MTTKRRFSTRTSGDLVADRRYAYADAALADGDFDAACDLFRQTLELVPEWPPGYLALAKASLGRQDTTGAIAALARMLALDPEDHLGARVLLAQIHGGEAPQHAMPDAYIAGLFDDYAPRFDTHLVEALNYRAPELLAAMLAAERGDAMRFGHAIDLGCGTGLMARQLAEACQNWTGVDLSAGMVREAERGGRYRRLVCGELLAFLGREPAESADLVIAADVFCYVPDLLPVFAETFRVLEPFGVFAFSIQTPPDEKSPARHGVTVGADARVHHALFRIREWIAATGFLVRAERLASTRQDRGIPVPGALFLLAKPAC